MNTCKTCGKEITKEDEKRANWHEYMGTLTHRMCPGTKCALCDKEITEYRDAKRNALMAWQHKSCKPAAISAESRKAYAARLWDEEKEERGWIVKK